MRWIIWFLASFFYFYEYFLRVAPSVMVPELMNAFSVDATAIGSLSAFYFYIYAPMQIPVGVMTDRFGARKLLAIAAFVAGIGSLFFAFSPYYWVAALGRFLMGGGSAFGFIGMMYICSHWFEEKKRGILIGLGSSIGTLGAVFGEGPLRIIVEHFGWRWANAQLGILGIILSIVIYLVMRNDPTEMQKYDAKVKSPPENVLKNLTTVAKLGYSWLIAAVSLFVYATTPGFAGLWGITFIHNVYGVSTELAGFAVSMIFLGWMFGGPLIGRYSDRFRIKKPLILICALFGLILMGVIVWVPNLPISLLFILFFLVGFVSGGQLLTYSYAIDLTPDFAKGTAAAFTNFSVMLGGALIQPFIGFLLDTKWTGEMMGGARIYSAAAYKLAMSCFPITFLIAFILGLFLKRLTPSKTS